MFFEIVNFISYKYYQMTLIS